MVSLINNASAVTSHFVLNLRHNIRISRVQCSLNIVAAGNRNGNAVLHGMGMGMGMGIV